MTSKKFALEVGGPKRLRVSWGLLWKNFVVRLDDVEIGRIDGGFDAVRAGATFDLPGGGRLHVQLVEKKSWIGRQPQLHLHLDGKPIPGSEGVPLPKWGFAFVAACGFIPILTVGGAIPAALGFGSAAACASIARDESKSVKTRFFFCLGITTLAWLSLLGFIALVGVARSG